MLSTIDIFGETRCLFASGFPDAAAASDFAKVMDGLDEVTSDFLIDERINMFNGNARRLYNFGARRQVA